MKTKKPCSNPSFQPRRFDIDYPGYPNGYPKCHGCESCNDAHGPEGPAENEQTEILAEPKSSAGEELIKRKAEITDGVELLEVLAVPVADLLIRLVDQISEIEEGKPFGEFQPEWEQLIKVRKILALDDEPEVPRLVSLVEEIIEQRTLLNKLKAEALALKNSQSSPK